MRETPHTLLARTVGVPSIPSVSGYAFASPNGGADAVAAKASAMRIASHLPVDKPHLAFVNSTAQAAFATLDRVAQVNTYVPTVAYPNNGLAQALRAVAGRDEQGRRHQGVLGSDRRLRHPRRPDTQPGQRHLLTLMTTLNDALLAFYNDLQNQGLLGDTLVLQFSEFGRRITENGSNGTDHGAASAMLVMGGGVRGGIYGTAPNLRPAADNPTLENNGGDVRYETDFRSVYARVIEDWLGASSTTILGGDFRGGAPGFL